MSVMTIRIPDDQYERLKALARRRGVSLNKLMEGFASAAIAEFDVETRFHIRASRGDPARGLALLDAADRGEGAA